MDRVKSKVKKLRCILRELDRVAIAFSGGVDSTFLVKVAKDVLGRENVLAVTASSETFPKSELKDAKRLARSIGVTHMVIRTKELQDADFKTNSPRRCYYCKRELFDKLRRIAESRGFKYVADASNYDDRRDFRPGVLAAKEKKIRSPLKEAYLTKNDIRRLSKKLRLSTWNKPSSACLASRIPYHDAITKQKLSAIESAEEFLRKKFKIKQARVRCHGDIARIEVAVEDIKKITKGGDRDCIAKKFNALGFKYVTVDLQGYRTGSMNETLGAKQRLAF